ncbi:NAD(P)-dependent alcohol dehydrogenase [bacterium AH-315-N03]|nr:NAD(P)-dependent alcohol dehydrogenase [bacterium AH-315-N03]
MGHDLSVLPGAGTINALTSDSADTPLELVSLRSRPLRPKEMRVRTRAIGVNPVDWKMRSADGFLGLMQRILGPSGPLVIGIDFAGEVVEVGAKVTEIEVGARVVGGTDFSRGQRGSYAEEVIVRPDQCAVLPDSVTFEAAACLPVAAVTAWMALTEHASIGADSRVLVLGASGGVGLFAIELAKMLGAEVAGVCSTRNVEVVERLGATAIDYTAGDALEAARAHGPYDLVLHMVGTETYPLKECRSLLSASGIVDLVAYRSADLFAVLFSRQVRTILGRATRARLTPLVEAIASGDVDPIIAERYPLADGEQAHVRSKAGRVVGKLVIIPD